MSSSASHTISPIALAKAFLAERFGGQWEDRYYLVVGDNECQLVFDTQVDESGEELYLTDIAVVTPGERLGGRILDALKDFADAAHLPVLIGPCTNMAYWDSADGIHPRRHLWLEEVGDHHGDPVFGYRPAPAA